ncbi:MAG: (2Fe-2S)-binding protein [Alphaproteobacteria bacterium]
MTSEVMEDTSVALRMTVNGRAQTVACDGGETLLTVLRERLDLTGTKRGCNQGLCGACTVLLDGKPARACLTIAATCENRTVETVEGLLRGARLSSVQQALVDSGAVQCGFCTPGMTIALTALLRAEPRPDKESVREALSGHLCRCTGYVKIVDAALAAAEANAEGAANDASGNAGAGGAS